MFLCGVVSLLALIGSTNAQLDLTTEINASGTDVVLATISLIDNSNVFSDDNRLLRRVARIESRDGLDTDTFRAGYDGGIWQVDEQNFLKTMDRDAHPNLAEPGGIYERLSDSSLDLDWTAAVWADLRRPLISAVAASIFFELAEQDIPDIGNVRGQGEFWKSSGFNRNIEDTVDLFVDRVTALELEECPNRGIDLVFVLDSSGSVGEVNFDLERDLVANVVGRFEIGPNATQVAVISYSGFAVVNFQLNNLTNRDSVLQAVSQVQYFDIPAPGTRASTNTADALIRLRTEIFTAEGGARASDVAIPRVAVVITDGQSNVNRSLTIPSALALRESGATVYSIGVGSMIDMDELVAIASSPRNVRLLQGFDVTEFSGLRSRITTEACLAAVPVEITRTINIELDLGETSFFEYQVPEEGMTVTLLRQQGSASLFASNKVQNPNSAFYDYRIDGEGEVFVDLQELLGDREKRDLESDDDDDGAKRISSVLFVSVEGIGNTTNSFQIRTSTGNTVNDGQSPGPLGCSILLLITLTLLLL